MARFSTKKKVVRGSGSSNPNASTHRLKARSKRRAPIHTQEVKGAQAERALTVAALTEHTRRTQDKEADDAMQLTIMADGETDTETVTDRETDREI